MKIYFAHTRHGFDYTKELYEPLRSSNLNKKVELILPHEKNSSFVDSQELIKNVDFLVADISFPATGVGMEIGYARIYGKPIIVTYKIGSDVSGSAKNIAQTVIEYSNAEELIAKLEKALNL